MLTIIAIQICLILYPFMCILPYKAKRSQCHLQSLRELKKLDDSSHPRMECHNPDQLSDANFVSCNISDALDKLIPELERWSLIQYRLVSHSEKHQPLLGNEETQLTKLFNPFRTHNLDQNSPRKVQASRHHSSGPNTGSNSEGGRIKKNNHFL